MIKTESIKIVKERELSFFLHYVSLLIFFFFFYSLLHNFIIFPPPPPHFYCFPSSSSSSFYCFLSFTHSFHFSFSTRFYKRLPTAIFSSFLWRPLHDYDVKPPNLPFSGGREHTCTTTNFPSSFWTGIKSLRIQLQEKSLAFDILSGSK